MNEKPIRLLAVDSMSGGHEAIQRILGEMQDRFRTEGLDLEVVGVAYNKRLAIQQFKNLQPDIVLIDLMLPGMRSIEVISLITGTSPETKVLALAPGDPPHDRIILALQAGALGYVSNDAETDEVCQALQNALRGECYLPKDETYEVLQLAASDLIVSRREKRAQFMSALIGLIPAAGILAAFTSFLWREYWGQIGVRVGDLGVDASSRVVEFLISLLLLFGAFGPLLFVDTWLDRWSNWHDRRQEKKSNQDSRSSLGWFLSHRWISWSITAIVILAITIPMNYTGGKILTIFIGAVFAAALLGNMAGFADSLPAIFTLSRERIRRSMTVVGSLLLVIMLALSFEVFVRGPDLRHDGVHGFLVRRVLDVSARPAMFYDLDEKQEPLGALYLGGNADLYVLYDPNKKCVRMIPVGSTRVEIVGQVPVTTD